MPCGPHSTMVLRIGAFIVGLIPNRNHGVLIFFQQHKKHLQFHLVFVCYIIVFTRVLFDVEKTRPVVNCTLGRVGWTGPARHHGVFQGTHVRRVMLSSVILLRSRRWVPTTLVGGYKTKQERMSPDVGLREQTRVAHLIKRLPWPPVTGLNCDRSSRFSPDLAPNVFPAPVFSLHKSQTDASKFHHWHKRQQVYWLSVLSNYTDYCTTVDGRICYNGFVFEYQFSNSLTSHRPRANSNQEHGGGIKSSLRSTASVASEVWGERAKMSFSVLTL